ncbi:RnfABCDGE type electron transport complex subunit G [Eubacteriales bacterium OttesenSCG-928-N14]|nr:RnfABCDGE type electron transport complex subunit G [Eubacteriales bacterium OttesenSCG-928-N14]
MEKMLKPAIRLLIITLIAGLALGLVYSVTKEPIAKQKEQAAFDARQQALDADEFIALDLDEMKQSDQWKNYFEDITGVYEGRINGVFCGWAVEITVKGYGGPIDLTVGITSQGDKISGVKVLSHSETAGLGAKITTAAFLEQFYGKDVTKAINVVVGAGGNDIDAISGASVSSRAVALGVTNAARCYRAFVLEDAGTEDPEGETSATQEEEENGEGGGAQ